MRRLFYFVIICLFINSINAQTTLKRYKSLTKGIVDTNLVLINVASATISPALITPSFKTIYDLTAEGQAAVLSEKTNDQITELLNKKFLNDQHTNEDLIDLTNRNIRITFSINRKVDYSKKNFNAYDRIENLNYSYEISDTLNSDVKFTNWNKYTTEYGTLDIGSLEYNQTFSANLDVTGKLGASKSVNELKKTDENNSIEKSSTLGPELSANANAGYSRSKKENQSIKNRFIQLTGEFSEKKFSIYQQGTRETELAGNVSIDLTISLPKDERLITTFIGLNDENNLHNPPDKIKIDINRYYIPDLDNLENGVTGVLNYNYVVRHIHKNAKTFAEFDDKICFITGDKTSEVTLIEKKDLIVPLFYIDIYVDNSYRSLTFDDGIVIQFLTYGEALEFKAWLKSELPKLQANTDLVISGKKIVFENFKCSDSKVKSNLKNMNIDEIGLD